MFGREVHVSGAQQACTRLGASQKQPLGQKRLTNVAVVRVKIQGLKFEVAW
jgi:hypothetical protein